jgi:4'-phosphopantetheinyl transferase
MRTQLEIGPREPTHPDAQRSLSKPFSFPVGRVDVWKVHLDPTLPEDDQRTVLSTDLSPDEIARANRFHFEKDRIRFTRTRSALRNLLSEYLAIPARDVCFEYTASGKPQLAEAQNPRGLQFSVSHAACIALLAFGSGHQLGVDVERIRSDVDAISLAERFFSVRERAGLRVLPENLLAAGFFACWTRKESFLKATGTGLSFPLDDFSVTAHPDLDPELEEINGDTEAGKQWFLADIDVSESYRATVAIHIAASRLEVYDYK